MIDIAVVIQYHVDMAHATKILDPDERNERECEALTTVLVS